MVYLDLAPDVHGAAMELCRGQGRYFRGNEIIKTNQK